MISPDEEETEPEWVTTEKKLFLEVRDLNKVWVTEKTHRGHLMNKPAYNSTLTAWFLLLMLDGIKVILNLCS